MHIRSQIIFPSLSNRWGEQNKIKRKGKKASTAEIEVEEFQNCSMGKNEDKNYVQNHLIRIEDHEWYRRNVKKLAMNTFNDKGK